MYLCFKCKSILCKQLRLHAYEVFHAHLINMADKMYHIQKVLNNWLYRFGTLNSNTVNSKFHYTQSLCETLFKALYQNLNIGGIRIGILNSKFDLIQIFCEIFVNGPKIVTV